HASWESSQGNAALVDELGLTDWLARRSVLAGPPERIIERVGEIAAMGGTSLGISQMVADPLAVMRAFGERIIPAFRERGQERCRLRRRARGAERERDMAARLPFCWPPKLP